MIVNKLMPFIFIIKLLQFAENYILPKERIYESAYLNLFSTKSKEEGRNHQKLSEPEEKLLDI